MANIREVYEIIDRATAPLRNIEQAMGGVVNQTVNVNVTLNENAQAQRTVERAMRQTDSAASALSGTIGKLVAAFGGLALIKRALDLSDELSMTQARLNNVNDGLQTTAELQQMIYQAAQRSRGEYIGMMQTVAGLKAQTGDTFSSVREAVAFTELLNKQFKIAGADATAISSTMYNLTQALSTGVLRGQDLNIVMSNAPQIAQRIARYMGVSVGELKELASQGKVTADIVKQAILGAADDINQQFEKMPMTFGDAMNKAKNIAVKAFEPLGQMIADAINSSQFEDSLNGIAQTLYVVSGILISFFSLVGQGLGIIVSGLQFVSQGIGGLSGLFITASGIFVGAFSVAVQIVLSTFADFYNVAITIVAAFVNGWNKGVNAIAKAIYNFASGAINSFASVASSADAAATAIANAFIAGANAAIGGVNNLINALNSIPGVNLSTVGTIGQVGGFGFADAVKAAQSGLEAMKPSDNVDVWTPDTLDVVSMGEAWDIGKEIGEGWAENLLDGMDKAFDFGDFSGLGDFSGGTPAGELMPNGGNVGSVGKVKKVDNVKLSDEDLKIYRDLAERRYMNNIELKTLAPEITVNLPAGASGNISAQDVADKLKRMLIAEMAAQTSVAHA
jgi:tape measure domain-containing protein